MQETIHNGTLEHDYMKRYTLKPGDVFVEAGAFWGRFGVVAGRLGAKVFLIEPDPFNRGEIEKTMKEFNLQFTVIPKAVGPRKGTMKFITWGNPSGHRLPLNDGDLLSFPDDTVDVEVDTLEGILDSLGVDHVDLLACDIEHAELHLVNTAGRWFDQKLVKHLALGAYHKPEYHGMLMPILQQKGYQNLSWEDDSVIYGDA